MATVLDYSAGFPGAQAILDAGHVGAMRYVGFPERKKCTTVAEVDDFEKHGLAMGLVFEDAIGDWRGGRTAGYVNAGKALTHARVLGWPGDRPIYIACDSDVVSPDDFRIAQAYIEGAAERLGGPALTGVYGEADLIDLCRQTGAASYLWQTTAWSRGRRTTANLYQRTGYVKVGGVTCDTNDVLTPDWGQAFGSGGNMLSETEYAEITRRVIEGIKWQVLAGDWRFEGNRNPMDMAAQSVATGFAVQQALNTVQSVLSTVQTDVGELRARPPVTVDAKAVADELEARGVKGASPGEVEQILRETFGRAANG